MHLKQPGFTDSLLGPFMKDKKIIIRIIKKIKKQDIQDIFIKTN